MSLSEVSEKRIDHKDCHLPQLSAELSRYGFIIATHLEMDLRRSGSGWVSWDGYTSYWSGCPRGHPEGVAVAIADRLVPEIIEVTPVNKRIMSLRITHTIGVWSLWSLCTLRPR